MWIINFGIVSWSLQVVMQGGDAQLVMLWLSSVSVLCNLGDFIKSLRFLYSCCCPQKSSSQCVCWAPNLSHGDASLRVGCLKSCQTFFYNNLSIAITSDPFQWVNWLCKRTAGEAPQHELDPCCSSQLSWCLCCWQLPATTGIWLWKWDRMFAFVECSCWGN